MMFSDTTNGHVWTVLQDDEETYIPRAPSRKVSHCALTSTFPLI